MTADNSDARRPRRRISDDATFTSDRIIASSSQDALAAQAGSANAITAAQKALFHLLHQLSPAVPALRLNAETPVGADQRRRWIDIVRFLAGTGAIPDLSALSVALAELDRGVTVDALQPASGGRRGGTATTDELRLMSFAVEAATELRRRCKCVEEYRSELKDSETSYATIEGYRKRLVNGSPELRPRSSYLLAWGQEAPEIVLQRIIWALRDLRKIPRNARVVES